LEIQVCEVALMQGHVGRDADTAVLKYARLDLDIIKRFGRFPRRNSLFEWQRTPIEQTHLIRAALLAR
jgi:uncharacterized protein (DUF924 family)